MKSVISLFFLLIFSFPVFSQYTKEIKAAFQDGEYFLAYQAYQDALTGYLKVYEADPDNANINYRIGQCYLNIPGMQAQAIPYLEKAVKNVTQDYKEGDIKEKKAPSDAYFFLGNAYQLQYDLDKAKENYETYLGLLDTTNRENLLFVKQQIASVENTRILRKNPIYYRSVPVSDLINTASADFDPVISADESSMVYISSLKFYDALFFVKKQGDRWGRPVNITPQVQSDGDLYPSALSSDGKTLLMSRSNVFNSDIWISHYDGQQWSKAQKLGKNINTKYWESSASFSPDGKTLYFTSNRKESIGGLDIFVSHWDETQKAWGPASNLGSGVNTPLNEETPYICEDNKTLFFSSQGYNSMGGFDIFYTTLQDDGTWSKPKNLGYPLNTTDNDLFFVPVRDGSFGYYAMYEPEQTKGNKDIYEIEIFSDKHPRRVSIQGTISLNDQPEGYTEVPEVTVINKMTGATVASTQASGGSGQYQLTLKKTGTFNIRFSSKDYESKTQEIEIPKDYSLGSLQANATLNPVKPEVSTVWLPTLFFDFDKSQIRKSEQSKLEHLATAMKTYPGLSLELLGYTDAKGSTAYNQRLAMRRVNAVKKALISAGIDASRISVKGLGEKDFLAINQWPDGRDCPEGRAINRRVSVGILVAPGDFFKPKPVEVPDQLKIK